MWRKQQQFVAMETKSATCGSMHLLSVLPGVYLDTPRLTRHRQHLTRQKYKFEDYNVELSINTNALFEITPYTLIHYSLPLEGVNENE